MVQHDTKHEGMISDTQFDFFGVRLATADSNGEVRIQKMGADQGSVEFVSDLIDYQKGLK